MAKHFEMAKNLRAVHKARVEATGSTEEPRNTRVGLSNTNKAGQADYGERGK